MNTLDERLAHQLHDMVDGEPDSVPPVGALLDRGRRARRRRTTTMVSATCALLALGIGTAATVATMPGTDRPAGTTAQEAPRPAPASPELKLVAAVSASENISYRMRLTYTDGGLTYEGAFDPRTRTGYVRAPQDDSVMVELLINGTRYEGGERPQGKLPADKSGPGETYGRYGQYPGKYDRLSLYDDGSGVLGAAAPDPAGLFQALKGANATISENPDGTLHFEYGTQSKDGSTSTAGDVTIDADGRIAKVVLNSTWQSTVKGRLDTGTSTATLELFDYGVEVTVKRPTDVVKVKE